jgi:hypothetical protein
MLTPDGTLTDAWINSVMNGFEFEGLFSCCKGFSVLKKMSVLQETSHCASLTCNPTTAVQV